MPLIIQKPHREFQLRVGLRLRSFRYLALVVAASTLSWCKAAGSAAPAPTELDLSGKWNLALDPDDVGRREGWYKPDLDIPFSQPVSLPGSLESQRIGNPIILDTPWTGPISDRTFFTSKRYEPYRRAGKIKIPCFLQPETYYRGPAWRRRTITIPDAWRNKRIVLELERCHWTSQVWLDGVEKGRGESLSTPHRFVLMPVGVPGSHELVVCIDNRLSIDVGPYAHSVTDHTQGNWNGVVGAVRLVATPRVWIDRVAAFPDTQRRSVRVVVSMGNETGRDQTGRLKLSAIPTSRPDARKPNIVDSQQTVPQAGGKLELEYPFEDGVLLWDEFDPNLYELSVEWVPGEGNRLATHTSMTRFGMREVGVSGKQLTLNDRKLFLRGTLECNVFPMTGYPATDVASWTRIMRICREYGLNHIRFHSHCPPEAAFVAADEVGIYLQVECGVWASWTSSIGDGKPVDDFLYREAERIIAEYGNHPSFLLMSHGNEPAGPKEGAEYLTKWVDHFRAQDGRRLYTGGSGWPMIPANQYHVSPQPRIYSWGAGEKSRINAKPPETRTDYREFIASTDRPVIAHEIGQWCAYPNFEEIGKYKGHLKPHNFEIFRDFLEAEGLADQAHKFLMASGTLQVACYKEEIESAMRTPGYAGFALLGLSDFPGQGTALVGVVDAFWDAKPYVDAATFHRFCSPTVPLARIDQRCFSSGESLQVDLELAHFGPRDLKNANVEWRLEIAATGALVDRGDFETSVPTGALTPIGHITVPLGSVSAPVKLRLVVRVQEARAENDWDLWVYPAATPSAVPPTIYACTELNAVGRRHLSAGGRVLLMLPADQVATNRVLGFSSIFWNTSWTGNQAPHTLGILCDPEHPLFAGFPTEAYSNWQWWELIHGAATMELDVSFAAVTPLVQVVPNWFDPKKLALAFEARVGGGSVVVTSMDLSSDLENRHAARQFRTSLLDYMASERFQPSAELTIQQIESLVR